MPIFYLVDDDKSVSLHCGTIPTNSKKKNAKHKARYVKQMYIQLCRIFSPPDSGILHSGLSTCVGQKKGLLSHLIFLIAGILIESGANHIKSIWEKSIRHM